MTKFFSRFMKDESGATGREYGLIASLVAIGAIGPFTSVGARLSAVFG
ncbi:MAG: Flp family type IVb pilin [Methylocystis sp.]